MSAGVSAVLFAKDARRVATFYFEVFGAKVLASDEHHSLLDCRGFQLLGEWGYLILSGVRSRRKRIWREDRVIRRAGTPGGAPVHPTACQFNGRNWRVNT
jgi:hypothetical protein